MRPSAAGAASGTTAGESPESLSTLYSQYFETIEARTPETLEAVYRLRYQVYCVEHDFLDKADNPGERETDECDAHSAHSLLIHRATGAVCGTVRLILTDPEHPPSCFPLYHLGPSAVGMLERLPRIGTAEISRFAVSKDFRRRAGESLYADVHESDAAAPGAQKRRLFPHITYGLLRAVLLMSLSRDVTHLCAVMDPALLRLIARFGLRFTTVGPLVDYHGLRQPCWATLPDLLEGVRRVREDMWLASTEGGRLVEGLKEPA